MEWPPVALIDRLKWPAKQTWTCPSLTFFYQSTETNTRKVNGAAGEERRSCGGKGERKVSSSPSPSPFPSPFPRSTFYLNRPLI